MRFMLSSDGRPAGGGLVGSAAGYAAGNLAGQQPIEVTVDLGKPGQHAFMPKQYQVRDRQALQARSCAIRATTRTTSPRTDFRSSSTRARSRWCRRATASPTTLAEFKGAIREIEVYPGHSAEWWFVPVATGSVADLRCGIIGRTARSTPTSAWWARSLSSDNGALQPSISAQPMRRVRHHDRVRPCLAPHQREQLRRVRRVQPHAAMRGRPAEPRHVTGAVDGISMVGEDRVRHRRPVVLARMPHALHALGLIGARRRAAAETGRNRPAIPLASVDHDAHALGRFVDGDEDVRLGGGAKQRGRQEAGAGRCQNKKRRITTPGASGSAPHLWLICRTGPNL